MSNLVINIATKNGTGSLSANQLLSKILFRDGWPLGSCNFFPSNIAGLPCLYSLRLNSEGWTAFSEKADVLLSLNPKSLRDDLKSLNKNSLLISDEKDKITTFSTNEQSPASLSHLPQQDLSQQEPSTTLQNQPRGSAPQSDNFAKNLSHQNDPNLRPKPIKTVGSKALALALEGSPVPLFEGTHLKLPFTQALREIEGLRPKTRPLFKNMIYVGLFCEWLKVENKLVQKTVADFFTKNKGAGIVEKNLQAISVGRRLACEQAFPFPLPEKPSKAGVASCLSKETPSSCKPMPANKEAPSSCGPMPANKETSSSCEPMPANKETLSSCKPMPANKETPSSCEPMPANTIKDSKKPRPLEAEKDKILIDGNTASALGALFAGCQFVSWYPITPASSLAENFETFAHLFQKDEKGRKKFFILQAEDEIGGICQALGAGWAGLRAMTVTSGPGLSLMSETAGLSYFAEIPLVLCNVQRAGPSTGLPTRTRQGDLLSACFLSHGDSKHIVLLPGTPEEAFHLTAMAFDLAEKLNSLVIVLSDLDLAMNLRVSPAFACPDRPLQRGRLLKGKALAQGNFQPYGDEKGDGISFRSLPGLSHSERADFTRGSGHNAKGEYSERPEDCAGKLEKLERKWQTAKKLVPQAVVRHSPGAGKAFVTFGPNEQAVSEFMRDLSKQGILSAFMRILSFPFSQEVEAFLKNYDEIFVVEQNRDGQMRHLLCGEFPHFATKMRSLLQYDGRPLTVENLHREYQRACKA